MKSTTLILIVFVAVILIVIAAVFPLLMGTLGTAARAILTALP